MYKKGILIFLLIFFINPAFCFFNFEKVFYSEFSVAYSSIISPPFLENNTTGTLDTPYFSGKLGIDILKWVNIYTGLSFAFFVERANKQHHYSFVPLFSGIKANLFPDFVFYPSFYIEYGKSFSNYHYTKFNILTMSISEENIPWTGDYYNLGLAINYKVNDIVVLILDIERPSISYYENNKNEIHIFKTGISFKISY